MFKKNLTALSILGTVLIWMIFSFAPVFAEQYEHQDEKTFSDRPRVSFHLTKDAFHTTEFILRLKAWVNPDHLPDQLSTFFKMHDLHFVKPLGQKIGLQNVFLVSMSKATASTEKLKEIVAKLNTSEFETIVEYAELNAKIQFYEAPNDPFYAEQRAFHPASEAGTSYSLDLEAAWDLSQGSEDMIVAVIDTGVHYLHEDLRENMWVNEREIPGNGRDDDGNGYIDDIHGYDFVEGDSDPLDFLPGGHGTQCASIIGAMTDNQLGVAGINRNVRMIALVINNTSDAVEAFEYAILHGATVINNSWGNEYLSDVIRDVMQVTENSGVLFVYAAGNDALNLNQHRNYSYNNIAHFDHVLIVASHQIGSGEKSQFSNYGNHFVHVSAPGDLNDHVVAMPFNNEEDPRYWRFSGTSASAPCVSGVAALLKAYEPRLTAREIKQRLIQTSKRSALLENDVAAIGVVNAKNALLNVVEPWVYLENVTRHQSLSGRINLNFNAQFVGIETIDAIDLFVDGEFYARDENFPFEVALDTLGLEDGARRLHWVIHVGEQAFAGDGSQGIDVWVANNAPYFDIANFPDGHVVREPTRLQVECVNGYALEALPIEQIRLSVAPYPNPNRQQFELVGPEFIVSPAQFDFIYFQIMLQVEYRDGRASFVQPLQKIYSFHQTIPTLNEYEALKRFYETTGGDTWLRNNQWKNGWGEFSPLHEVSQWEGITVRKRRVKKVELFQNHLVGVLQRESLAELQHLTKFDVRYNFLSGELPIRLLQSRVNDPEAYFLLGYNVLRAIIPSNFIFIDGYHFESNALVPNNALIERFENRGIPPEYEEKIIEFFSTQVLPPYNVRISKTPDESQFVINWERHPFFVGQPEGTELALGYVIEYRQSILDTWHYLADLLPSYTREHRFSVHQRVAKLPFSFGRANQAATLADLDAITFRIWSYLPPEEDGNLNDVESEPVVVSWERAEPLFRVYDPLERWNRGSF